MQRLHPRVGGLLVAGVLGLVATGCNGAIPGSSGGTSVKLMNANAGSFLVDGRGHTLYLFERDDKGESYCNGACAAVWPPFEAKSQPHGMGGVPASALGSIKRDDGERQVTYQGHPLYYYAADASTPGKAKGEAVHQFGAEWYLVDRNGKPVEAHGGDDMNNSNSNSNSSNGGGY
jgi:predicted lipoprotein with Yx(FWY)xxD motif